jgi:alpha-L-fucosidase
MLFAQLKMIVARLHIIITALMCGITAAAEDRTAWLERAGWGVMTHYLADWRAQVDGTRMNVGAWNRLIDQFDVEALADRIAAAGAGYHLLTIGQNSGYYLSPNDTYDSFVGRQPSRCSRRDLPADMAAALAKRGVKLLVYLPSGPPGSDEQAGRGLSFEGSARRNREFQLKWEAVIEEWSIRWGDSVAGWWFDGCYWPNITYRHAESPNFETFAAAARAGNPSAVVAFNPGVVDRVLSITPFEDYAAGEINHLDRLMIRRHEDGKIDGTRIHVLSHLGRTWGKGEPRFTPDQIIRYTRQVTETKGAITWDVPVESSGQISPPYLEQLSALGAALSSEKNEN